MKTPDIKYINLTKPRRTKSITTHREDTVYPAHTEPHQGFSPHVRKQHFDYAVECIKMVAKTGNVEHATDWLNEMGLNENA